MLSSQILQISTSYFRKENQEIIQIQRRLKGFLGGTSGKEPACQCRRHKRCGFDPWIRKNPWRRTWQSTPVFLPGESHGQRSLVGYSLRGHKESDITEQLTLSLSSIYPSFSAGTVFQDKQIALANEAK